MPSGRLVTEHATFGDRLSADLQETPEGTTAVRQFLIAKAGDGAQADAQRLCS